MRPCPCRFGPGAPGEFEPGEEVQIDFGGCTSFYPAVDYSRPGATASWADDFGRRVTLAPTQEYRGCGCEHE